VGTADHSNATLDGVSVGQGIYVYVEDVDAHFERARAAGARVVYPPEDTPTLPYVLRSFNPKFIPSRVLQRNVPTHGSRVTSSG
jgi:predicted enzyme related to lactoylglutathione lyase